MIGERIRKIIEKSGLTVSEVAEKLGTTTQNMYKIFAKDSVHSSILENLSAILDKPIQSFFGDFDDVYSQLRNLKVEIEILQERLKVLEANNDLLQKKLDLVTDCMQYVVSEYDYHTFRVSPFFDTSKLEFRIYDLRESASSREEIWLCDFLLDKVRKHRQYLLKMDADYQTLLNKQAEEYFNKKSDTGE